MSNISKLYEAFDAFTNKDFDEAETLLHEFLVDSAKNQLKESWAMEDAYEDEDEINYDAIDSIDADPEDDIEGDIENPEEDFIGDDMDSDFAKDVQSDSEGGDEPATKNDVMDIEDKIDNSFEKLLAAFEGEGDSEEDDSEEDDSEEAEEELEDELEGDSEEDDSEEGDSEELDEMKDDDGDLQLDEEDELEESVDFQQNVKGADKGTGDSEKSPSPKQNTGGKAEGKMGGFANTGGKGKEAEKTPKEKDTVSKDGNQGSGKTRQRKVSNKAESGKSGDGAKSMDLDN